MKVKSNRLYISVCVVALGLHCQPVFAAKLKVAFFGSLSGPNSNEVVTDNNLLRGWEFYKTLSPAAEKLIELEKFDYQGQPELAATMITDAKKKGFNIFVGFAKSNQLMAVAKVHAEDKDLVFFSPLATHPKLTEYSNVFTICSNDNEIATKLAKVSKQKFKPKRVLFLENVSSLYSQSNVQILSKEFEAEVKSKKVSVDQFSYTPDSIQEEQLVEKVKALKPDLVFIPDYASNVTKLILPIHKEVPNAVFVGGDGWAAYEIMEPFFKDNPKVKGYFINHWHYKIKNASNQKVYKIAQSSLKQNPTPGMALMYDIMSVLVETAKLLPENYTTDDVIKQMRKKSYSSTTGPLSFKDRNFPVRKAVFINMTKGQNKLEALL